MTTSTDQHNKKNSVVPVLIERELQDSFLDYAMSVVVSRALPDIRDGLKPVHRRVLYTMHLLGYVYNRKYHKSVGVVGEALGKFHPHGDQALYNTMVGMVQDFSKRYPLLDGQGNWGSVDGDSAAAMRYTEVRMQKIAQELLADIEKETVPFVSNFDESTTEPTILPSRLPHLLLNGAAGIAVGMATSIPPHNLTEIINACLALLRNSELSDEELFSLVPAPDFPTGGTICGRGGIVKAYRTGRGSLILRGTVEIVEDPKKGTTRFIITELPYQVNKAELSIKIADLVKEKVIDGITNIRDESNKNGMRLIIDLRKGENHELILNQLYKYTPLQSSVSILMLGILDNKPLVFSLRELLQEFLHFRKEIISRRTQFDLNRAKEREHLLEGFIIGLQNIDEVVALIKKAHSAEDAGHQLNKRFLLSSAQAKALLEMRLQRLTAMETEKIHVEMSAIKEQIITLRSILENESVLKNEIVKELEEIKATYADTRKTRIEDAIDILDDAALIPDEDMVVTITMKGYVKRVPLEVYGLQHRGGKGKMGMATLDGAEDAVQDLFVARNHDMLLFFTNFGRVYSMSVFEVPEASRTARGRAVINLIQLQEKETVVKLLCTRDIEHKFLVLLTKNGIIKRCHGQEFANIRSTGIRALTLKEEDELVFCALSNGSQNIIIATAQGQGIRFKEEEVRAMGRQAAGVIGITLRKKDTVVGMEVVSDGDELLIATEHGYGKKTHTDDFRVAHRGGIGVRTIPTNEKTGGQRNGLVIGLAAVHEHSNVLLIDNVGKIIRLPADEIRTMGRQAKGVRLIRLDAEQTLAALVTFAEPALDQEKNEHKTAAANEQKVSHIAAPEGNEAEYYV